MAGHGVIPVTLSDTEMDMVKDWGDIRFDESKRHGDRDIAPHERDEDEQRYLDRLGVAGEYVFCKGLLIPYVFTVNTYKDEPDVFPDWEIRTPRYENRNKSLIIHCDNDVLTRRFALVVTLGGPEFEIRGWIRGTEAKRDEWKRNPGHHRPAWFVPQSALHPFTFES